MIFEVKIVANAKEDRFKKEDPRIKVYLKAPAVEGKANKALISFLSEVLNVSRKNIHIIKGLKSSLKTISIEENFDMPKELL